VLLFVRVKPGEHRVVESNPIFNTERREISAPPDKDVGKVGRVVRVHCGDEGVPGLACVAALNRAGILAKLQRDEDQRNKNANPAYEFPSTCEFVE
jgi:hypothetical protein